MIKAVLIKNNKPIKTFYYIKSVTTDKKYEYFVITEHIFKHDIIHAYKFSDVDRVEMYKPSENYYEYEKKPYKVVERE